MSCLAPHFFDKRKVSLKLFELYDTLIIFAAVVELLYLFSVSVLLSVCLFIVRFYGHLA